MTEPKKAKEEKEINQNLNMHEKKLKIMHDLAPFMKDGNNTSQNFKYISEAQVSSEFRELFVRHGMTIAVEVTEIVSVTQVTTKNGGTMFLTTVKMKITLDCGIEKEEYFTHASGLDSGDKGINKAMTSGLKYFLLRNFLSDWSDSEPDADDKEGNQIQETAIDRLQNSLNGAKNLDHIKNIHNRWIKTYEAKEVGKEDFQIGLGKIGIRKSEIEQKEKKENGNSEAVQPQT